VKAAGPEKDHPFRQRQAEDGQMTLKVGLIVGREWSFPPAFIEEVNRRDEGVTAEYVTLGAPRMDQPAEYAVIIDRISHEVPFYRTFLKQAVLQGTTVVNNPFMWTADDKFFGAALATSLGIAHPKTVVLPNKEYIPGIVKEESLRNLQYPLDWQGVIDYVGLPCVLKDAHGGGWKDVYICRSLDELIYHYDNSGLLTMVVQEFIKWDHFIRCICLGQEEILPIRYDPGERKYHVDHAHMSDELGRRVVADSLKLVRALGYDMNSMEWAVKDGVPYAIDFMNPAPDMDVYSLTPHYFDWVVKHMADMAIRLAKEPRKQAAAVGWESLFQGRREMAEAVAASPVIQAPRAEAASTQAHAGSGGRGGGGHDEKAAAPPRAEPPASGFRSAPHDADGGDVGGATLAASGYLIGGGRAGDPPSSGNAIEADGVDSADFLVGDTAAGLEFEGDPGDEPDDVVDEEASEGHA
jgi:glutathione synthase/RimK-type ligase-like ATP-grasp enzyme